MLMSVVFSGCSGSSGSDSESESSPSIATTSLPSCAVASAYSRAGIPLTSLARAAENLLDESGSRAFLLPVIMRR